MFNVISTAQSGNIPSVKGGCIHGETDELSPKVVTNIVNHFDYHATLMYLFGLSGEQLSIVRPTGINSLLDGQPGEVVTQILNRPPVPALDSTTNVRL